MLPSILAQQVRTTILDYLRTTFHLSDPELERALFRFLKGDDGLFRGPFFEVRLPFRVADENTPIPLAVTPPFTPYEHQLRAFERLSSRLRENEPERQEKAPLNTLVTTGTGSGKTECFLYPVLDHCVRHRDQPGIKAIILYPMNALATDQAGRLARLLHTRPELKGVTAGLYVGGKGSHKTATAQHLIDDRDILRGAPPDILLTNYKMLDFLLLRPEDRKLWAGNEPRSVEDRNPLRYLVIDELHIFDGAQGSDAACLIRRLKARLDLQPGQLCCVGTSATIGSELGTNGASDDTASQLVGFASRIFGEPFGPESVVTESRVDIEQPAPGTGR